MRRSFALVAFALSAACSLVFPVSDHAASGRHPADDAAPTDAAALDVLGITGEDSAAPLPCPPSLHGPALVRAGAFCIDATQVTVGQYQEFVAAGVPLNTDNPRCEKNTSYALTTGTDAIAVPADDRYPAFVDWCDAIAYCAWAGKHLCAGADGEPVELDAGVGPSDSEWFLACGGPTRLLYPYSNDEVPDACAGLFGTANLYAPYDQASPVATHPACEGGYPRLLDMVGNGRHWVDICQTSGCVAQGGRTCRETSYALITVFNTIRCCAR